MDNEMIETAMAIIMAAGDARLACTDALNAIAEFDYETAESKMKEASKKIAQAHHLQTEAIQGEIQGKSMEHNVLFAHAQDTLMTIYSEINLSKQLLKIAKSFDDKLSNKK